MRQRLPILLAALALAACGTSMTTNPQTSGPSLYTRLGGMPAITAVIDEFVSRVAADTRINSFFAAAAGSPTRLAAFKANLVDQVCAATGGPCVYRGKDMTTAHAGMGITHAHFVAPVEDLAAALDKFNVPHSRKERATRCVGAAGTHDRHGELRKKAGWEVGDGVGSGGTYLDTLAACSSTILAFHDTAFASDR